MNPESLTWRLLTAEELTNVYLNEMRRDFPAGEQVNNQGQIAMYLVEDAHEPIIGKDIFDKVQHMKGKIKLREQAETIELTPIQAMVPLL